jgi:hypothetical protein
MINNSEAALLRESTFLQIFSLLTNRQTALETDLAAVQFSANQETKSSAGDKYETGRAMAQLEIEKLIARIADLKGQLQQLERMRTPTSAEIISTGNLVITNLEIIYLSISLGPVEVMGSRVLVISTQSPLGKAIFGKRLNDKVDFMNKSYTILAIV